MSSSLQIVADPSSLARTGAAMFGASARESVAARGVFRVALAGGSTPRGVYETLAAETSSGSQPLPWSRIHVFWGDERAVPPDHRESNYRMAYEALLTKVPIPQENIHRIRGEEPDPHRAAELYEPDLIETFGLTGGELPRFDLILLGMGADGHTASLFPSTPALESTRLVAAVWVERLATHRITLTPRVINHAVRILFLVSGADKAKTLCTVLEGKFEPERFPAQIVRPTAGEVHWLVDAAAATLLSASKGPSKSD